MNKRKGRLWRGGRGILIGLFFLSTIILPLIANIAKIQWNNVPSIVQSDPFKSAVVNSIIVSTMAAFIALVIAFILAYIIERTNIKRRGIWRLVFIIPMLIPSISHGLGLINIFGDNGFVTDLLGIDIDLYGFNGVLIGSVMYSFPVAFLMLSDVLHYMDMEMYEAAKVLGIPGRKIFVDITLANLKKPLIATYFAIFTMIFTDYGIPLAVGGKFSTLAVFLYREVVGLLDFSKGGFITLILLIPALVSFVINLKTKDISCLSANPKSMSIQKNKLRDCIGLVICIIVAMVVVLPIISFMLVAFVVAYPRDMNFSLQHIEFVWNMQLGKYLWHSIVIAMSTATVGTMIAYLMAYKTTRTTNKILAKSIYMCSLLSLVVPGMVLGLGYVQVFGGTAIYGTVYILILVNISHFFSSPYLMAYNALNQVSIELEHMGTTLGIRRWRVLKDVIMPTSMGTILEMFSYFFVNAMITISAVSFLYNTKNMPLSIMINQLEGQLMLAGAAVVSIVILGVNGIFKIIIYSIKRWLI